MRHKPLGTTSVQVPVVGLGTMGMGGYFQRDTTHDREWIQRLRQGIDRGMTLLDTAEIYGAGHAEELIGQAIAGQRDRVIIATKFSIQHSGYTQVIEAAEASLKRLGTDYIDLYQSHWPNPRVPFEETLQALDKLVDDGKVRFIGLSNFSHSETRQAMALLPNAPLVSLQHEYNSMERTVEQQLLPWCQQQQLTLIAYSPLNQGKYTANEEQRARLSSVAQKYGCTLPQMVLAWLIHAPPVVVIPKAGSEPHLTENAWAGDLTLAAQDVAAIAAILRPPVVEVLPCQMGVAPDPLRATYHTLDEALANGHKLVPSPSELARQLAGGDLLKPVKVKRGCTGQGDPAFLVVEGKLRYWAWRIAFGEEKPIPVLIQE